MIFTSALLRLTSVTLRFTSVTLRFTSQILRFTSVFLRFTSVILRLTNVILWYTSVILRFTSVILRHFLIFIHCVFNVQVDWNFVLWHFLKVEWWYSMAHSVSFWFFSSSSMRCELFWWDPVIFIKTRQVCLRVFCRNFQEKTPCYTCHAWMRSDEKKSIKTKQYTVGKIGHFQDKKNLDFPALFDIWGISIWISRTFWHLRIFNLNFPHFLTFEEF